MERQEDRMSDLISRQAAIDIAQKLIITLDGYEMHNQAITNYCVEITQLPSAQPEPKKGEWIEKPHVHGVAYCSLCDYELHTNDTNFCPNCGSGSIVGSSLIPSLMSR